MFDAKEYNKQWRIRNKDKLKEKKHKYYEDNRDILKQKQKEYDSVNKLRQRQYNKTYYEKNKEKVKALNKDYYSKNREHAKERSRIQGKIDREKYKTLVFDHYGRVCTCCGETMQAFLTIDHINGGGNMHRNLLPSRNLYRWLVKNNYPIEFQTLCMNCNYAKRFGECPHKKEMDKS